MLMSSTPLVVWAVCSGGTDLIACMVTAVGLTCACAEFFAQYLRLSYRTLVFILGIFSMLVSNLGLSHLIQISIPVLTAIYPPCIVLVLMSFTLRWWQHASRIVAPVMLISLVSGILDAVKASTLRIFTGMGSSSASGRTRSGMVTAFLAGIRRHRVVRSHFLSPENCG